MICTKFQQKSPETDLLITLFFSAYSIFYSLLISLQMADLLWCSEKTTVNFLLNIIDKRLCQVYFQKFFNFINTLINTIIFFKKH